MCEVRRKEVDGLEEKTNNELEEKYAKESEELQKVLNSACGDKDKKDILRRLEECDNKRREAQEGAHERYETVRKEIDDLEESINNELRERFTKEDSRLQTALNELQTATAIDAEDRISAALQKAKTELLVMQKYDLKENKCKDFCGMLSLGTEKGIAAEWLEVDKPEDLRVNEISNTGRIFLTFTFINTEQEKVLFENGLENVIAYKAFLQKKGGEAGKEYTLRKEEDDCFSFVPGFLEAEATYTVRVVADVQGKKSEWSEEAELITPEFTKCCVWEKCPDNVDDDRKYSVDEVNPRVATKTGQYDCFCTIIGNTPLPPNKMASWSIKILKSKDDDGNDVFVGVAPFDTDQNEGLNSIKCRWYFHCYGSTLRSGPPHNYTYKMYGPRKKKGNYVHTGDSVGVVMDTAKGELSFTLNGVNLGVAYEGIPLDKPLVPCVLLRYEGDSVELDTSEVKENVSGCIIT